jgi:hypothetical protein
MLQISCKLKYNFSAQVTLSWEAMKPHFPQECSKVKNNTDVQSVLNSLNTQNDVQKAQEETHIKDDDIKRGQGSDCKVICNKCNYTNMNIRDLRY